MCYLCGCMFFYYCLYVCTYIFSIISRLTFDRTLSDIIKASDSLRRT